ncbi:hypothetical protein NFI96_000521 [Prochilodus magdalenae]|nr:hypothetical protein NFI96_000521 [Prochilodus magdalenae]
MDYSLDLYTYRVSCMVSGEDTMDRECRYEETNTNRKEVSERGFNEDAGTFLMNNKAGGSSASPRLSCVCPASVLLLLRWDGEMSRFGDSSLALSSAKPAQTTSHRTTGLSCVDENEEPVSVSQCIHWAGPVPPRVRSCWVPCKDDCTFSAWSKFTECSGCGSNHSRKRTLTGEINTPSQHCLRALPTPLIHRAPSALCTEHPENLAPLSSFDLFIITLSNAWCLTPNCRLLTDSKQPGSLRERIRKKQSVCTDLNKQDLQFGVKRARRRWSVLMEVRYGEACLVQGYASVNDCGASLVSGLGPPTSLCSPESCQSLRPFLVTSWLVLLNSCISGVLV